ncbi:hypothetical protein Ancab_025047 [Ancistrocladus abbreviatus]
MESNTEMQAHRSLTNMSMKKLQKLVKASFSNKHHLTNPPIQPKHRLVSDENTPPPDPNIQPTEPYIPLFNTPKSPSKPLNSHKQLEVSRLDCHDEVQSLPDPPVKVIVRIKPADSKEKIGDRTVKKVSDTAMRVGEREFSFDSILDSNSKQVCAICSFLRHRVVAQYRMILLKKIFVVSKNHLIATNGVVLP